MFLTRSDLDCGGAAGWRCRASCETRLAGGNCNRAASGVPVRPEIDFGVSLTRYLCWDSPSSASYINAFMTDADVVLRFETLQQKLVPLWNPSNSSATIRKQSWSCRRSMWIPPFKVHVLAHAGQRVYPSHLGEQSRKGSPVSQDDDPVSRHDVADATRTGSLTTHADTAARAFDPFSADIHWPLPDSPPDWGRRDGDRVRGRAGAASSDRRPQDHQTGFATPELLRRFEQESQALGRLQHPGIAQIYEAGTADSGVGPQPYFAMELVRGQSLVRYAEANRISTGQRLEMMVQCATRSITRINAASSIAT